MVSCIPSCSGMLKFYQCRCVSMDIARLANGGALLMKSILDCMLLIPFFKL